MAIKIAESNDNEDLLGNYLAESPERLPESALQKIADTFGLPISEVKNIAKGMVEARRSLAEQEI